MASNSIRIDAGLFEAAREEGGLQSRSTAQQIEHWARLGASLESCGLTVSQVAALLRGSPDLPRAVGRPEGVQEPGEWSSVSRSPSAHGAGDEALWAFKRSKQSQDMASAAQGRLTQQDLSWFAGGKARGLKVIGAPY